MLWAAAAGHWRMTTGSCNAIAAASCVFRSPTDRLLLEFECRIAENSSAAAETFVPARRQRRKMRMVFPTPCNTTRAGGPQSPPPLRLVASCEPPPQHEHDNERHEREGRVLAPRVHEVQLLGVPPELLAVLHQARRQAGHVCNQSSSPCMHERPRESSGGHDGMQQAATWPATTATAIARVARTLELLAAVQHLADVAAHDVLHVCQLVSEAGRVGGGGRVGIVTPQLVQVCVCTTTTTQASSDRRKQQQQRQQPFTTTASQAVVTRGVGQAGSLAARRIVCRHAQLGAPGRLRMAWHGSPKARKAYGLSTRSRAGRTPAGPCSSVSWSTNACTDDTQIDEQSARCDS